MLKERVLRLIQQFIRWSEENPRKAFALFCIFAVILFKKLKQRLKRPKSVRNKVVLITGGVSGIGRLLALKCKKHGAKVVVWDVNTDGIAEMEEQVDISMYCDVTNREVLFLILKK